MKNFYKKNKNQESIYMFSVLQNSYFYFIKDFLKIFSVFLKYFIYLSISMAESQ